MPYSTIIVTAAEMAAVIAVFYLALALLEWKRRDTDRRSQRLVSRNLQRMRGQ